MSGAANNRKDSDYKIVLSSKYKELYDKLQDISLYVEKETLVSNIIEYAKKLVTADHVHLRTIDWTKDTLNLEAHIEDEHVNLDYTDFKSIKVGHAIGGNAFKNQETVRITDVQDDDNFRLYLKNVKNNSKNPPELIQFLESIDCAICVPLFLRNKTIGVITAVRFKKSIGYGSMASFSDEDQIFLEHYSGLASVLLRNAWLFEATTWRVLEQKSYTVDKLCLEVVKEARRRTYAMDGRVRFVDWTESRLVPGALVWNNSDNRDPRVYIRTIGEHPTGLVASTHKPIRIDDLKNDPHFNDFKAYIMGKIASYQKQKIALEKFPDIPNGIIDYDYINPKDDVNIVKRKEKNYNGQSENTLENKKAELQERYELLDREMEPSALKNLIQRNIQYVTTLEDEWKKYAELEVDKWNSELAVPIMIGDRLLGVLNVHSEEHNWFTESDQAILQALAGRVAVSIMEHQQSVYQKIYAIEQKMMANQGLEELASLISKSISEVAFFSGHDKTSQIFPLLYRCKKPNSPSRLTVDKEHFGEKFEAQYPKEEVSAEYKDLFDTPIRNNGLGFVAVDLLKDSPKEPVFIVRENVDDPISHGSNSAQTKGVITTACLPLVFKNKVYGLLYIHIKERHFFTELERETLTLFAALAAIVMRNFEKNQGDSYNDVCGKKLIEDCIGFYENAGENFGG